MTSSLHSGGPLVVLDDVHLTLESAAGPVNILRGVSLKIAAGETVSLVGPSGSGKSTVMMVIGGLERPSAGRVFFDSNDFGELNEDALARLRRTHIGIVFQAFHLIPTMTALENVALPLELAGRREAFSAATEGLDTVDAATSQIVIDCLFEHQARCGTTLLLITHDPGVAERCERQIHLLDGKIIEDRCTAPSPIAATRRTP